MGAASDVDGFFFINNVPPGVYTVRVTYLGYKAIEVEKVQEVLMARTGDEFSSADVRVAANSAIYEKAPLDKYLSTSAKKLRDEDRLGIAQALAEVINADGRVSSREIEFFNRCVDALSLTPAQLMGLEEED